MAVNHLLNYLQPHFPPMSDSPRDSASPVHTDGQIDFRVPHRHARSQEWSTGLDSILDEYAEDYAGNEYNPTGQSAV